MAYCVAGSYTIQNCLLVGTESFTGVGGLGVSNTGFNGGPNGLLTLIGGGESSVMFQTTNMGADTTKIGLDNGNGSLQFRVGSNERMRISCAGNVGIGTTNPTVKLYVSSTSDGARVETNAAAVSLNVANTGNFPVIQRIINNNGNWYDIQNNYSDSSFTIDYNDTERMRITSTGNVGIGATAPSNLLHVCGAPTSNGLVARFQSTASSGSISISHSGNGGNIGYANIGAGNAANTFFITTGAGTIGSGIAMNNGGYVGIGTCTPGERLAVNGNQGQIQLRVDTSDGSTINVRPNSGRCGWVSFTEDAVADRWGIGIKNGDAKLYFSSGNVASGGGTTRMVLDGSGNLVVNGTDGDPLTNGGTFKNLVVYGGAGYGVVDLMTTATAANSTVGSFAGGTTGASGAKFAAAINIELDGSSTTTGVGRLVFYTTGNGAAAERMRITCAGNVGINTTSPTTKLSVEGSANDVENVARFNNQVNCTTRVWLRNSNHSAYWGLSSTSTADPIATGTSAGAMTLGFGNNFPIQFWNGSSASVKMTIASDGNVGIGTSSPSTVLDIRGCNTDNAVTVRNFCGDSYSAIGYVNCEGTLKAAVGIGNNSAAAPFANNAYVYTPASTDFLFYIAGAERMRVRCDGNVGIATTSPSYKLHVNGTFYAAGSSIKYKEGICNYDTNSCLFMCLKPVAYQYKDEFKHLGKELKADTQIGLIAEDVAEVMPELAVLVNEEDEKVVRNVDYEKLSIVLLAEVQKLRKEMDELKQSC